MVKGQAIKEDNEDGVKINIRNVGNSPNSTSSHPTKILNPQKICILWSFWLIAC